jgi:hypothetical protein
VGRVEEGIEIEYDGTVIATEDTIAVRLWITTLLIDL